MKKKQTEFFKKFIKTKEGEVSDVICLLDECADKLELLEDSLIFWKTNDISFSETSAKGLGRILGNIRDDIRLISAEMMTDVKKDVAELKKRQAEEKKKEREEVQDNP